MSYDDDDSVPMKQHIDNISYSVSRLDLACGGEHTDHPSIAASLQQISRTLYAMIHVMAKSNYALNLVRELEDPSEEPAHKVVIVTEDLESVS